LAHKRQSSRSSDNNPKEKKYKMLVAAERCAKKLNRNTKWIKTRDSQGEEHDILVIFHGDKTVFARQDGEYIVLFVKVDMTNEWKEKIRTISDETRKMILNQILSMWMMSRNTGFAMHPVPVNDIKDLSFFILEQIMILKESDVSTINRFSDGIQELVSITLHTMIILNTIMPPVQNEPVTSSPSSPDGMYA